jgi:hypothetical protein
MRLRSTSEEERAVSYVVNWQEVDGSAGWHSVAEIGDAVAHVEGLRNGHGVEGARIFRLEEVEFLLKPYFRVELAASVNAPVAAAAATAVSSPEPPPAPVAAAEAARPVHGDESWVEAAWPEPANPSTDGTLETAADGGANGTLETAADGGANGTQRRGLFGR